MFSNVKSFRTVDLPHIFMKNHTLKKKQVCRQKSVLENYLLQVVELNQSFINQFYTIFVES